MAVNTLNIYTGESTKDNLATVLDGVVENIQTSAVSEAIKNKEGSGDPQGGTIEYKRFANATLNAKGTARSNGAGHIDVTPVLVNLNDDKEIVEELQNKDIKLYGIEGLAQKRANNFGKRISAYLDREFFKVAVSKGTKFDRGALTDTNKIIDAMIVQAKEVESDFIDGIDAEDLALVLNGTYRKALKNQMDGLPNGTAASNGLIGKYDGVDVFETHRLPEGINAFVMLKGAIAQPFYITEYNAEKVPLDDAIALQNFVYSGREALNPEAIIYDGELTSSI